MIKRLKKSWVLFKFTLKEYMGKKENLYIVIPAYNEAQVIGSVINKLIKTGYKFVLVVDDGSKDETKTKAEKAGAYVVRHMLNRGKGAAVKTGIEAAKLLGASLIVTIDADGQHNPDDIHGLVQKIHEGYEVVLGSRFLKKNNIPFFKKAANIFGNFFTWFIFGFWVSDSQSGLRAYSESALKLIDTKTEHYEFDSEVIREIGRNKLKVIEVPIHVNYSTYSQRKKQKQSFSTGISTLFRMVLSQ